MIATIRAMNNLHLRLERLKSFDPLQLQPETTETDQRQRSHVMTTQTKGATMKPAVPNYRTPTASARRFFSVAQERSRSFGHQLSGDAVALGRNGSRLQAQDSFRSRRELPSSFLPTIL